MNLMLARVLTRLYPRRWRERYGAEFTAFLEDGRGGPRTWMNVAWSAVGEYVFPTRGGAMDQATNQAMNPPMNQPIETFGGMVRRPSAFLPLAMSIAALMVAAAGGIFVTTLVLFKRHSPDK